MKKLLALLLFAAPLAAQTINPSTQITWPRVSGSGTPIGHITCPSTTNSPTTATVGTPYTDKDGPHYWQCGTAGWFQVDGGGSCSINVNGVSVPCPANLNNTTPAPDAGYLNATVRKDGSGNVSFEVPNSTNNVTMEIPDPLGTQSAVIYPTSYTISNVPNGTSTAQAYGSPAASTVAGGISITVPQCAGTESTTVTFHYTGWNAQASWINPVNVSSVTAFAIAGMSATSSLHCAPVRAQFVPGVGSITNGTVTLITSGNPFALQSLYGTAPLAGADIDSATASFSVGGSGATSATTTLSVPVIGLRVYDSIDTKPASVNGIEVTPPLQITNISGTPVISFDPAAPYSLFGWTLATLPLPEAGQGRFWGVNNTSDCQTTTSNVSTICYPAFSSGANNWVWTPVSGGGGGGAVSSVSNSDGTLTVTPTTGAVVGSLNLGHANTWTASQTFNLGLTIASGHSLTNTGVTDGCGTWASGVLGSTGTPCGTGSGGGLSGQTTNYLPKATSSTASTTSSIVEDTGTGITIHGTGTGAITLPEGTAVSGSSGNDVITADSATHQPLKNANNAGANVLVGTSTTAATSGHLAVYSANGYDVQDGGAVPSGSSVSVNGSSVSSPNFNGATPAAGSNGKNVTWQASGSSVSAEVVGDGNATHYLDGTGAYSTPAGSGTIDILSPNKPAGSMSYAKNENVSVLATNEQNLISYVPTSITAWSITSNVVTFTATNTMVAGMKFTLSGFGTSTFFNGQTVTVISTGLSSSQFEAAFTHANGSGTESGTATPLPGYASEVFLALAGGSGSPGGANDPTLSNVKVYLDGSGSPSITIKYANFCFSQYMWNNSSIPNPVSSYFTEVNTITSSNTVSCRFTVPIPYTSGLRITWTNSTGSSVAIWSTVLNHMNVPITTWTNTRVLHMDSINNQTGIAANAVTTLANYTGGQPGRYVGMWWMLDAVPGSVSPKTAPLEGDYAFYLDGATDPQIQSSGTEDWFGLGNYFSGLGLGGTGGGNASQVQGGWHDPSGQISLEIIGTANGNTEGATRFHINDPITFNSGFKVTWPCGDTSQVAFTGTCTLFSTIIYYTQN